MTSRPHGRRPVPPLDPEPCIRGRAVSLFLLLAAFSWACDSTATGVEERRIGPEGGTAVLANGEVRISIPPGALGEDIWFTVTPAYSLPSKDFFVSGSGWEIGPPGTVFSRPVTLTISYDPGALPPGIGGGGLGVFTVAGTAWTLVPGTFADPGGHAVSGQVTVLGRFGVAGLSVASVELSPATASLEPDQSIQVQARALASDGRVLGARSVTWTSSDPEVASVSAEGVVTAHQEGSATVSASSGGYEAACSVSVRIPVTTVVVEPSGGVLNVGEVLQLAASARDGVGNSLPGREVTWSSSVPGVATVDNDGRVTAVAVGSTAITASVDGQHGSATIGVHAPLAVSTDALASGVVGDPYSQTLAAVGGDGTYTWFIEEGGLPQGLSVDGATGLIAGVPVASGPHNFTVRAESVDQEAVKDLSIYVAPLPVATVEVHPASLSLTPSESRQLSAVARDALGTVMEDQPVSWGSSDESVATVTSGGQVTAVGAGSATVTARAGGQTGWAVIRVTDLLAITDTPLRPGMAGEPYLDTLEAVGGNGENTWSLVAGNLPPGLSLDSEAGIISGTPTLLGTTSFIVQVVSGDGQTATRSFFIVVRELLTVETEALPDGIIGDAYDEGLEASGGAPPYRWTLESDTLPTGLTLDEADGRISGVPLQEGSVDVTVRVESQDGQTATRNLTIAIHQEPAASIDLAPSSATIALGESQTLSATVKDVFGDILTGRTIVWNSSNPGVATVDVDGTVTAVGVGSATITAQVDDVTDLATISVYAPLAVLTQTLANGVVGEAYGQALSATGGDGTYTWTVTAGTLPDGLSLDEGSGVISGTPTTSGLSMFVVQVGSGGQTATQVLSITVG